MPFVISKMLDHGTANPIVARLSLQVLKLLDQCAITKEFRDKVGELYVHSLQRKLLRCWEIEDRYRQAFNAAVKGYKLPAPRAGAIELPQVPRLEEECHNFLYETKNYIRDLLAIFNLLYGTEFSEASEFYRPRNRKGAVSVVQFAEGRFGEKNPKTLMLLEAATEVEKMVGFRNAVEHPGGYSGVLRIVNFTLDPDGKIAEPAWGREQDGKLIRELSAIRVDMGTAIENLLQLGEDVLVSWVVDNLKAAEFQRLALIPDAQRDPMCPIKWTVTLSEKLEAQLAAMEEKQKPR